MKEMNTFKKVIRNCHQAILLIEKKSLAGLSFRESVELRIHLTGCSLCRLYQKQSAMIGSMVGELFRDKAEPPLDEGFKQELQDRIDSQLNNN